MKCTRLLCVLVLAQIFVPLLSAQSNTTEWLGHMAFRQEMEALGREGQLKNPLLLLDLECRAEGSVCEPQLRLFVRSASIDLHRIPLLPTLAIKDGAMEVDKAAFKADKKGDAFETACQKLPVSDLCTGNWALRKVWKITEPAAADSIDLTLKTELLRPGASSTQIGSRTPEQVLVLHIPIAAIRERLVIPLWEQGSILNMPETYQAH